MKEFTFVKSFCVSEFGKVEVTSTPAESSFFWALTVKIVNRTSLSHIFGM
jgi:hypothetical protein